MIVFVSLTAFFARPTTTHALFGVGDFNVSDAVAILKDAAAMILTGINNRYSERFINDLQNQYKINDYLNYTRNLAEMVYTVDAISKESQLNAYVLRANISKQNGTCGTSCPNLSPVYNKQTLDYINYADFLKGGAASENAYDRLSDSLLATPQGQKALAEANAGKVLGNATTAATMNLSTSNGQKDLLDCNNTQTSSGIVLQKCTVGSPAQYVSTQIGTKVNQLFGQTVKPYDGILSLRSFFSTSLAQKLGDILLNRKPNQTLVSDFKVQAGSGAAGSGSGATAGSGTSTGSGSGSTAGSSGSGGGISDASACISGASLSDMVYNTNTTVADQLNSIGAGCFTAIDPDTGQSQSEMFSNINDIGVVNDVARVNFYKLHCLDSTLTDKTLIDADQKARQASIDEASSLDASYIIADCPTT
ncbi:MAG: hypothetical protein JWO40_831 [Candidatus Doudnabacteria bacterium]|nr:hypothetical protein [Candidatus Doudnabacteria bacterium]